MPRPENGPEDIIMYVRTEREINRGEASDEISFETKKSEGGLLLRAWDDSFEIWLNEEALVEMLARVRVNE